MSARRLTVYRIHPDGREAPGVPDLTPARARGLAALFLTDNRYAARPQATAVAVAASHRLGETIVCDPSGAAVRMERVKG